MIWHLGESILETRGLMLIILWREYAVVTGTGGAFSRCAGKGPSRIRSGIFIEMIPG
jgi:hypothetical protein